MNYAEKQKEEIATVGPRTVTINLSDADVIRIFKKAASVALTPGELIANFIADLVGGTYTNGSDERMYATEWFDRCDFSQGGYGTFLAYLVKNEILDYFTEMCDDISDCSEELSEIKTSDFKNQEDYDEEVKYLQRRLQDAKAEAQEMFDDYCGYNKSHETYEQETQRVKQYLDNLKTALAHKNERTV